MGNIIRDHKLLLAIGQFALFLAVISFLVNYLMYDFNTYIAFATGLFIGLALVLNLSYLAKSRKPYK